MRVQLAGGLNMMQVLNSVLSHKAISNVVKRGVAKFILSMMS